MPDIQMTTDIQIMTEQELTDRFYENEDLIAEYEDVINALKAENIIIIRRTMGLYPEEASQSPITAKGANKRTT
jgi:hypothetical protein